MSTATSFLIRRTPSAPGRPTWLLPVLVLAGALLVRLAVSDRSLWLDETISLIQIDRPFVDVITRQINGVHPPLFHVLLHGWIELFGSSTLAMRSLSILWSLVAVAGVGAWSRHAFPHVSPLPAAAFAALAPFAVWYGTEIRMYSQLFALTALGGWLSWSILAGAAHPRRRIAALGVVLAAIVYTHYFGTLFVASLGLVALTIAIRRSELRRPALAVFGLSLLAGIVLIPWVALVISQRSAEPLSTVFDDPDFFTGLIAGIEMLTGFRSYVTLGVLAAGWPLICLLAIVLLPQLGMMHWRVAGLLTLVVGPPVGLILVSIFAERSAFDSRYLTVCVAPLYVVSGWLWTRLVQPRLRPVVGTVMVAAAISLTIWQNNDPANPKLYELREAMQTVNSFAKPGDAVMVVPQVNELGGQDPVINYYEPRDGLRYVDTSPEGRAGVVAPETMWDRVSRTKPDRIFVLYGFDSLAYETSDGELSTGDGVSAAYDGFLDSKSRQIARLNYANVSVKVYAPRWKEAG
jgi:mannosyltransferase